MKEGGEGSVRRMPVPGGIPVVDTMIGFAAAGPGHRELPQVRTGLRGTAHTADYMFRDVPTAADPADPADRVDRVDPVAAALAAMDRTGVAVGLVSTSSPAALAAARRHPERFALETHVGALGEPFDIVGSVRRIRDEHAALATRAVSLFPVGPEPATAVDGPAAYPVYATCAELGLPVFVNAGVPGPRVPMGPQHVEAFDRVCHDFPDLTIVLRHGAEPWADLAVDLMRSWPGLHYSTSAFAPKYYPAAVLDYLGADGAHKVLYGGYFPMALTLDRIFAEFDALADDGRVPDDRWEPFLGGNARRILGLAP